ncbi:hypothetical protein TNCV_1708711 [Trichonephila clavipes]|nr:hypothetical protein TNCV_1708711 [Trichonephila clavipes]
MQKSLASLRDFINLAFFPFLIGCILATKPFHKRQVPECESHVRVTPTSDGILYQVPALVRCKEVCTPSHDKNESSFSVDQQRVSP